jgi:3-dehydroquinate dehydratase II
MRGRVTSVTEWCQQRYQIESRPIYDCAFGALQYTCAMTASLVYVLNGPNLNRLGSREPGIYGSQTLENVADLVSHEADLLGMAVDFRQTNDEAELIGWIHEAVDRAADVVLNPAAFTHYSYAVRDACALVTTSGARLIEIHLSNPASREEFRHTSVIAGVATGTIAGFGSGSYLLALRALTLTS